MLLVEMPSPWDGGVLCLLLPFGGFAILRLFLDDMKVFFFSLFPPSHFSPHRFSFILSKIFFLEFFPVLVNCFATPSILRRSDGRRHAISNEHHQQRLFLTNQQ